MTTTKRRIAIPVPPEAVRTAEQILAGETIIAGHVWRACGNCGGTGNYPSMMIPAGACRFYCWEKRTPETFGKVATPIETFVKREQAHDRANYRSQIAAAERNRIGVERTTNPDPRIATVAAALGIDFATWFTPAPESDDDEAPMPWAVKVGRELVNKWVVRGDLSEAQWGLLESLPARYAEHTGKVAAAQATKAASAYVGTVGDRLKLEVTVETVMHMEGHYGARSMVRFRDAHGNALVWWASGHIEMAKGETLKVRATVKEHSEYKGEAQTIVSRVFLLTLTEET